MTLTQESILSFLLERGGKVKNSELLNSFMGQINCSDPAEKQHNRDLFKKLVNSVAVVKQINEVKFVVVKKRYQDFVKDFAHDGSQKTQMDDSFSSQHASLSYTSPHQADTAGRIYSDMENTECYPPIMSSKYYGDVTQMPVGNMQNSRALSKSLSSADTTTVKVLNISGDQTSRTRRSGAVFAVIAVKSPPRDPAPEPQDGLHSQVNQHRTSDKPTTQESKVSTAPVPTLKDKQPPGFPQAGPQNKTTRQTDDIKYSESVPLEPMAHEWLVKCAAGQWGQVCALLLLDTRLAQKKDFMSGFTALHWAAKEGNSNMIHKLIGICRNRGTYININSKAHGGYTPLHIAAIHGHTEVLILLVQGYGANANERDNDGKKAFHYLGDGVSAEIRALLGGLEQSKHKEKSDDEEYREHTKGFNTISKLFQPHLGKKQKYSVLFLSKSDPEENNHC
uniref:SOWAHA-C winged helix-turn-helix domain-containing protein n=1 Tax=Monopterus albus TaxID=43700 RepID=A0A3Q3J1V2_MONAL